MTCWEIKPIGTVNIVLGQPTFSKEFVKDKKDFDHAQQVCSILVWYMENICSAIKFCNIFS